MHHRGLQHGSVHRKYNHRSKQQPCQHAELNVGSAAQKTIPVAQVFGHRHHHQQQRGQQDKHTAQRASPLATVRCPSPIPHVVDGCQCDLASLPNYASAGSNHVFSLTHSAGHVEPASPMSRSIQITMRASRPSPDVPVRVFCKRIGCGILRILLRDLPGRQLHSTSCSHITWKGSPL